MSKNGSDYFYQSGGGSSSASSGGTGKNYITQYKASKGSGAANPGNGDFELGNTTNFSLGNVGTMTNGIPTGTSPTFGSGANGNLSLAIASTSTLGGLYSMDMISAAATTVGDCVATAAFFIDAEDQAKVLSFKIAYTAQTNPTNGNWSGTNSNSYGVAVWDATNSVFLPCTGQFNIIQSSGIGYATGTVQTGSTTASMRLMIYNVSASSGAITLRTDDWSIGPQTSVSAPAMTDWVAYTPIFTGFGTVVNGGFYSRRVGDTLEIHGLFTCGTVTGVANKITMGFNGVSGNVTLDTTKVTGNTILGNASRTIASTTYFGSTVLGGSVDLTAFQIGIQSSTLEGLGGGRFGSAVANNSDAFEIVGSFPIVGWSSNTSMSSDTDTRVVAMSTYATPTGTPGGSATIVNFGAATLDNFSAWNGSTTYTIPVTGIYEASATIANSGTAAINATAQIELRKNNVAFAVDAPKSDASASRVSTRITGQASFNAGDTITVFYQTSLASPVFLAGVGNIAIKRLSGPAVIAATESVVAIYQGSGSQAVTADVTNFTWATKVKDTHGIYSAGLFTVPASGTYSINYLDYTTAGGDSIAVYKNGSLYTYIWFQLTANKVTTGATIISVVAGDTLSLRSDSSHTRGTGVTLGQIAIARIGN